MLKHTSLTSKDGIYKSGMRTLQEKSLKKKIIGKEESDRQLYRRQAFGDRILQFSANLVQTQMSQEIMCSAVK